MHACIEPASPEVYNLLFGRLRLIPRLVLVYCRRDRVVNAAALHLWLVSEHAPACPTARGT